jgi:hypothetical protein
VTRSSIVLCCGSLTVPLCPACGETADLGNYVVWSANHETGDTSQWQAAESESGVILNASVSDEHARSGGYSLRIASTGPMANVGAGFDFNTLREAYFSAWFYLPSAFAGIEEWNLMGFASRGEGCPGPGTTCPGVDVKLRSLPNGELLLYVFNDERDVLQPPLSAPPVYVPVARWFHVEARYRRAVDHAGRFTLWVDGTPEFGFEGWRTAEFDNLFWNLGSPPEAASSPELYVDDAAISRIAVTPSGRLVQ